MTKSANRQPAFPRPVHLLWAVLLQACLVTGMVNLLAADSPESSAASPREDAALSPFTDVVELPGDHESHPNDVTNPELLANHLRGPGETLFAFYTSLDAPQRADLIMALNAANDLHDHIAEMMVWEPVSELRALLWQCIDPADFAAPEQPSSDPEMIALLDLPTVTPIGVAEWVARMEIACSVDPEIGREWVISAQRAFPESHRIQFTSSLLILNHGTADQIFTTEEMAAASQTLTSVLSGEQAGTWSAETRIRAYYALYFARDSEAVAAFFRQRQRNEPDPRAREVLQALRTRLIVRTASPP